MDAARNLDDLALGRELPLDGESGPAAPVGADAARSTAFSKRESVGGEAGSAVFGRIAPPSGLPWRWSNFATSGREQESERRTACRVPWSSTQQPL
jgi:hypothetical protein